MSYDNDTEAAADTAGADVFHLVVFSPSLYGDTCSDAMFPFFSFGSLYFALRLLRCIIYLFIYLHILLVSFLPLLIFIIFGS